LAFVSCSSTPRGALDANLALARDKAAQGAKLFGEHCASCHGQRGEGLSAPVTMGKDALPEYPKDPTLSSDIRNTDPTEQQLRQQLFPGGAPMRQPFRTAGDLYDYVSKQMPKKDPGSLGSGDYWNVITFLLIAHGAQVPPEGVKAQNASSVVVRPAK
jgi:mono/diheme cytochrome c family protein